MENYTPLPGFFQRGSRTDVGEAWIVEKAFLLTVTQAARTSPQLGITAGSVDEILTPSTTSFAPL
jgi:hypothetical protein